MQGCDGELYRLGGDEFAIHLPEALRKRGERRRRAARSTPCATTASRRAAQQGGLQPDAPRSASRSTRSTATTCRRCSRTWTSRCTRPRTAAATATCCSTRRPTACAAPTSASTGRSGCATRSTTTAWCCSRQPVVRLKDQQAGAPRDPGAHPRRRTAASSCRPFHRARRVARADPGNRHAGGREAARISCSEPARPARSCATSSTCRGSASPTRTGSSAS